MKTVSGSRRKLRDVERGSLWKRKWEVVATAHLTLVKSLTEMRRLLRRLRWLSTYDGMKRFEIWENRDRQD